MKRHTPEETVILQQQMIDGMRLKIAELIQTLQMLQWKQGNINLTIIEDLERDPDYWKDRLRFEIKRNEFLIKKICDYREALEFYADANNWTASRMLESIGGRIAREALKE